jgi:hypothetical protein
MSEKSKKIAAVPKVDTRGLPFSMDPRYFYVYSALSAQHKATGVEKFLYELMPISLIRSLAFAIDPLSQFKLSATRISPATRTRTRKSNSVLNLRSYTKKTVSITQPYPFLVNGSYSTSTLTYDQPDQKPLNNVSLDIVKSDRPKGSDMGEFSMWKVQPFSSPRTARRYNIVRRWYTGSGGYWYDSRGSTEWATQGPAAYITPAVVDNLRISVQNGDLAALQDNVLNSFSRCSSQRRATTLFRNIVELRDLPRSILQLQDSLRHLRNLSESLNIPKSVLERIHSFKTTGFDIPKEYLSYSFGWRQTYSDMRDALLAPERISKRVNFLIRRNGKATTYRSATNLSQNYTTTSGFAYAVFPDELTNSLSHLVKLDRSLRMVINTTFEFPSVNTPTFRSKEFYRQLGVVPNPIDLYNLVPWTWLVDWFTGFGNYLEVIRSINEDRNLINWGVFTCSTQGELRSTYASKISNSETYGGGPTQTIKVSYGHTSVLSISSQLRRDVSGLLDVKTTGDTSKLSTYQLSILGSILAGKLKF